MLFQRKNEHGTVHAVGAGQFKVNLRFKPSTASFTVIGNEIEPPASNHPVPPDSVTCSIEHCKGCYQLYFQWQVSGAKVINWNVQG